MTITRRKALLTGAAAAASLPLLTGRAAAAGADLDIAIVGGGLAGSYAALRLVTSKPGQSIRLFEMSERIGGRLRSVSFPQAPGLIAEAGGARFPDSHRNVVGLARTLDLTIRPTPLDMPQDRLALRGRNIPVSQIGADALPYEMPAADVTLGDGRMRRALAAILPEAATLSPAEWRAKRLTIRIKGKPLAAWNAGELLAAALSPGERDFLRDTARVDDAALSGNALALFDWILGAPDSEGPFFTIAGGFQKLPLAIAEKLAPFGDIVSKGERLVSLAVPDGKGGTFKLAFEDANGRRAQISAKTVILALPRAALEAIPDFHARAAKPFAQALASVTTIAAVKGFLLYSAPWWTDLGITAGRSLTDSSARQFEALGVEAQRLASEPSGGFGLLATLSEGKDAAALKALAPASSAGGLSWLGADSALAQELRKQAAAAFGVPAPAPVAAAFQDWSVAPYGGGLAAWVTGADPLAAGDAMLQPLNGRALYVVGDTWSARQNWAEGALEQTEAMLQKHFGLNVPSWVNS